MFVFPLSGPYVFPDIDPVLVSVGSFAIRWYAIAYLLGFVATLLLTQYFNKWSDRPVKKEYLTGFLTWAIWGVILGGRLGYVLFYAPAYFVRNPLEILAIWQGGMSFHGGALGLVVVALIFCRSLNEKVSRENNSTEIALNHWYLGDLIAMSVPVALFFGRLANFANAELWGRVVSDVRYVPWAVIFPNVDSQARHPSQIYEALAEGLLLFIVIGAATKYLRLLRYRGAVFGLFIASYSLVRFALEFTREPDAHIGLLFGLVSMGQVLSLGFFVAGLICLLRAIVR